MPPRMRTRSAGRPAAESLGGGTGERVSRGGRGRRPREGNDERVDELNGQGNDQGMGANGGVEGVNGNVEGANGGAPDFSTIIAQQLQNLLPAMLAQVSNRGNVGNQNGNVVNENVQENVGNVIVNGNRVGCSYKEFLACNPKEYDGKGGVVVLTRWIEKMESVHDMSGCSIDQKVKYTAGSFVGKALTCHEMQKLESELWNHAMVGASHAAYTDRFHELDRLVPHLVKRIENEAKTVRCTVAVRGGRHVSTRYCSGGGWTNQSMTRGTGVCQSEVECSDPEVDIDEIDAFLAMEVSSNFEEGYYDSEGDAIFLKNLLSDDTTHNLAPEVISDHEFAGELLTLPSRIAREHDEYLSLMTLLCEISTSQNVHTHPSSIITSPDPVQEEI
ncbi:hypothetical protein Tco_1482933, partial [Tanacetum coccineum]